MGGIRCGRWWSGRWTRRGGRRRWWFTSRRGCRSRGGWVRGSANAAAALIGLERELGLKIAEKTRLEMAAAVGSDVPLFLVGGAVLGTNRGECVAAAPAVTVKGDGEIWCVIALPGHGVSTPQAFRDWDGLLAGETGRDLHNGSVRGTMEKLSRTYASVFGVVRPARAVRHLRYLSRTEFCNFARG